MAHNGQAPAYVTNLTHIQPPGLSDLLAKLCSMSQGHTSDKKVTKALHSLFSVFFFF